jgi:hypothetical protein
MMNATYQLARLYVQHCGFSVAPMWYKQKSMIIKGTAFAERPPTPEHLRRWFASGPVRNIAIIPGDISDNLVIVDFDDFGVWSVFHALTGYAGPVVRTARGVHLYARCRHMPERNGQGFFEDLHVGQIIVHGSITAPPSVHPSGHIYQWCVESPQRIPYLDSLADLGLERRNLATDADARPRPLPQPAARSTRPGIANPAAYASAAIRNECQKILDAAPGQRNARLYTAALKVSKYADVLGAEPIAAALDQAARQAGLSAAEIRGTIRSGFNRGVIA